MNITAGLGAIPKQQVPAQKCPHPELQQDELLIGIEVEEISTEVTVSDESSIALSSEINDLSMEHTEVDAGINVEVIDLEAGESVSETYCTPTETPPPDEQVEAGFESLIDSNGAAFITADDKGFIVKAGQPSYSILET
jgi:hypothetical protein